MRKIAEIEGNTCLQTLLNVLRAAKLERRRMNKTRKTELIFRQGLNS